MKHSLLFLFGIFLVSLLQAQIYTGLGVEPIDSADFETSKYFIEIDTSASNLWQIGAPQKAVFTSSFSLPNAIITDTIQSYPTLSDSYFDLVMNVDSFEFAPYSILISFQHRFETTHGMDGAYIQVSMDDGLTWFNIIDQQLSSFWGLSPLYNSENLYQPQDTLYNGEVGFSGSSDGWKEVKFQFAQLPVKRNDLNTLFRFHFISDSMPENLDGWMIDNLVISTVYMEGGIPSGLKNAGFRLFPNPAQSDLTVEIESVLRPATIEIYSIVGEMLIHKRLLAINNKVDISSLKSGSYFVRLHTYNGNYAKKLVVKSSKL